MRGKLVPAAGAVLLVLAAVTGCAAGAAAPPVVPVAGAADDALRVAYVVDGDVVQLTDGRQIHVVGVDAPGEGECGHEEAKEFARAALLNRPVRVTGDPTQPGADERGRTQLYLDTDADFSAAVARAGWARHSTADGVPALRSPAIEAAQSAAQSAGLGIWSDLCAVPPSSVLASDGAVGEDTATDAPADPAADVRDSASGRVPTDEPAEPVGSDEPADAGTDAAADADEQDPDGTGDDPADAPPSQQDSDDAGDGSSSGGGRRCHPSYWPCLPDVRDLSCRDIGFPVLVVGPDEYDLDRDRDGYACLQRR